MMNGQGVRWRFTGAKTGFSTPVALALGLIAGTCMLPQQASAQAPAITLYDGHRVAMVAYDPASGTALHTAADLLAGDLSRLSGQQPVVASDLAHGQGTGIIIGLAASPAIAALIRANHLSTAAIDGKWETYGRAVIPAPWNPKARAILIYGADTRGAIWGVIDLTREMGVSAWEWWADVATRRVDCIAVSAQTLVSKEPSVKYRGFFINADNLKLWAANTYHGKGLGPESYKRVFELMWRLKANMLWPAMNGGDPPFNADPENYRIAQDYAIVRGTSHVEMLLRNNALEWDPKVKGPYNWVKNKDALIDYWRGAVETWGKFDNLYTIGMRGADDFPMEGADSAEKMGDILHDVVTSQRRILSETLRKPADQIPQVFTPYKEVGAAYNTGRIHLPDDVTIVWPDDNYGYMAQLDNAQERKRPGGAGVYYHTTFWGAPGAYLFLGSTDPNLMWEEMRRAYHTDARNLWMLNVGNIKPVEYLTDVFLAMAFDMDAFAKPGAQPAYLRDWSIKTFGPEQGPKAADIMARYYRLAFDRNPEFMGFTTTFPETPVQQTRFNLTDFGDENARRAEAYKAIMTQSKAVLAALPRDRKAAFFELVDYTVNTGGNMNLQQLALDKSLTYGLQRRASASTYGEEAARAHQAILDNVRAYNQANAGGKWNGIVTDMPQTLPNYLAPAIPHWSAPQGPSRCGVQVEGGGFFDDLGWWYPTLPSFHKELGQRSYFLDIFTEQPGDADWSALPNAPWIKVDQREGHFSATKGYEQRLHVSIDWSKAPANTAEDGLIHIACSSGRKPIDVHVRLAPPQADRAASFIDSQGVVAIEAAHADSQSNGWTRLDGVGHTGADMQADLDMAPVEVSDATAMARAPHLLYRFATQKPDRDYSFPNYVTDETATLRAVALPLLPATKGARLRIAVAVDGAAPRVLDFAAPYYGAVWRQNVLDNAASAEIPGLPLKPGSHRLEVWALDPSVTLDRFEISFAGAARAYGPMHETRVTR
jgi:hypothetical protein